MFEARKHTMFARWDKMAKAFTRAGREIAVAVRQSGDNPESNPALKRAIQNARSVNMPKDKIEAAIKRASGADAENWEEALYEGYAPHGIALMVVTATNNPTRTVANLRMHFKKNGGNLGNTGSVGFLFNRMGVFKIDPEGVDADELELEMIDHGLEELEEGTTEKGDPALVLRCDWNEFGTLQAGLDDKGIEPLTTGSEFVPTTTMELGEEQLDEVLKLIDVLEQDDDVQNVFSTLA
jgi:YebC/PmpR family DNA-binding regulatory protein